MVFVLSVQLCLAVIFGFSALSKLPNMKSFLKGVENYKILGPKGSLIFGHLLPWVELGLCLSLVLGIAINISGAIIVILMVIFLIGIGINLHRRRIIDCNCFGLAPKLKLTAGTFARNSLILILGALTMLFGQEPIKYELILNSPKEALLTILLTGINLLIIFLLEIFVSNFQDVHRFRNFTK